MKGKAVIYLVLFLAFASFALGANPLDVLFDPIQGVDFGAFYAANYAFVDTIIYLLIFLGLARFVFSSLYKDKQSSKAITIGIGLALTFGAVFFELRTGFNLGLLGPFAALIILIVFLILVFELIKSISNNDNVLAASIAIVLGYGLLRSAFFPVYAWLAGFPVGKSLLHIALIVAFIILIIKIFSLFKGTGGKDSGDESSGSNGESGKDGKDGADGKQGSNDQPGQQGSQGGNGSNGSSGSGGGSNGVQQLNVAIQKPSHNQKFNVGEELKVKIAVSGGKSPYYVDVIIDGVQMDHDASKGVYEKSFGNITAQFLKPGEEHALVARAFDSQGGHAHTGIKFKVSGGGEAELKASFEEPSKQIKRKFKKSDDIPVRLEIKGGKPPYSAVLYLNGTDNQSQAAGEGTFQPDNQGKKSLLIKKDNKKYLDKRKVGEDNNLLAVVVDSAGKRVQDGTVFEIEGDVTERIQTQPEGDKQKINSLDLEIINPKNKNLQANTQFDFSWIVNNPEITKETLFNAEINFGLAGRKINSYIAKKYKGREFSTFFSKGLPKGKWILRVKVREDSQNPKFVEGHDEIEIIVSEGSAAIPSPTSPSVEQGWKNKIKSLSKKIQTIGDRINAKKLSLGSFASQYIKKPSELNIVKELFASMDAINQIKEIIDANSGEGNNEFRNDYYSGYTELLANYKILRDQYEIHREDIIHLCNLLNVNYEDGHDIERAIHPKEIAAENDRKTKSRMRMLLSKIEFLYEKYSLMFQAMDVLKKSSLQMAK